MAGGGVALLRAKQAVGELKTGDAEQDAGIKLIMKAIEAPCAKSWPTPVASPRWWSTPC